MLDIKTKDFDAREELLLHRKKTNQVISLLYTIAWAVFLIAGLFMMSEISSIDGVSATVRLLFITTTATPLLAALIVYFMIREAQRENNVNYYNLMIYLKKMRGE